MTCTGTLSLAFTFDVNQRTIGSIACSPPCATCSSASYCLTCKSPQLASSGQCVSTCPTGTFNSSGACVQCHPDCASCSGSSFEQCSACFPTRPVLSSGRCLPTCVESQFFDLTNSTCQNCDSSCSSCSGPGSTNCLACSSPTQVLRSGSCVSVNCVGSSNVVPDLGVCLSDLVQVSPVPSSKTTKPFSSAPTVPSSGSSTPSVVVNGLQMAWWKIFLMVLGGIFIIVVVVVLWRRCMRNQRAEETVKFADAKERSRMRQLRDRWLRNKGEYPEGLSMAYRELDRHRDSRSVYSQDIGLPWQVPGTYSIRNSV